MTWPVNAAHVVLPTLYAGQSSQNTIGAGCEPPGTPPILLDVALGSKDFVMEISALTLDRDQRNLCGGLP